MKKTTYAHPAACWNCGNTDRTKFHGDWTGVDCDLCGKRTPYDVVKTEDVPDVFNAARGGMKL